MHFYAVANAKVVSIEEIIENKGGVIRDCPDAAGAEHYYHRKYTEPIPVVRFEDSSKPLELKIGFSFVSVDGAKKNLEAEMIDKTFEQVKKEGNAIWNGMLAKINVEGGSQKQKNLFYTTRH